ncbi:hypothetical protein GCM10027578_00100 [Spirosoma luteolum]
MTTPLEVYPMMTLPLIRQHFSEQFPYLQLSISADSQLPHPFRQPCYSCFLIEPGMTVAELVDNFRNCFGLTAQVRRWTGASWHDTDDTVNWSLAEQNRKGSESVMPAMTCHR